jgi:hypothetical protein
MRIGFAAAKVVNALVIGGLLGSYAVAQAPSSAEQYVLDGKAARAITAQQEHRKLTAYWAAAAFEKSLDAMNVSDCERRIDSSPESSIKGARMSNCKELISDRRRIDPAPGEKLRLHNHDVQLTGSGARVTLDILPTNERDVIVLKEVSYEQWLVTSLTELPRGN